MRCRAIESNPSCYKNLLIKPRTHFLLSSILSLCKLPKRPGEWFFKIIYCIYHAWPDAAEKSRIVMKGSLRSALIDKKSVSVCTWERAIERLLWMVHDKKTTTSGALMLEISRTYHKRDFLCAMSRFRVRFFIRLKLMVPSSFFLMLLLMAIKFHLKKRWVQPNNILKAKGSERDFLCRNPKGIFIIFALVFIVLMLIRCIASRPFHEKEHEEEEEDKSIRFV